MKITIVAVGQRQPAWAQSAVDDYLGRFPADFKVEIKEVKAEARSGKGNEPVQRLLAAEAARIRAASPADGLVVALDERGADWTTRQLATTLGRWRDDGAHPVFVIGGPDGLDAGIKQGARAQVRLSSMTLPHALARVLLAEQIYRAWSMLAHHPYHRA
ncbi:MAG: 23S rRNA (pseudouridine(1915)-N(3))-methyltransferase RlmH [Burkholderiaceae bacterium]|jgi:23S rRNA (pseudouridine1915-N3)-methyltransferase|nr:23S rRNA (pseudouridine(1915)-N(3))-methyltransferase RlmH [Burkholderiaceae bacterium]MDH5207016.1 23S rRNA (pseudouridine(1915)-N(3))-methyltransferase RlmH [Burkholderiaceae bacterium]